MEATMPDPAVAQLVDRVTRLEQDLRWLKRVNAVTAVILAGFAVVVVILVLHSTPATIQAERFVFRDAGGRTRAALVVSSDPPVLQLMDSGGKVRWQAP
jgi:hypothetical protein